MSKNNDFWDFDFEDPSLVPPIEILSEQANFLETKSNGLFKGQILTKSIGSYIYHYFYLIVPALGNYRYQILSLRHEMSLYPLIIDSPSYTNCADIHEFKVRVSEIINSPDVKRVVQALYAQARAKD
ncbi:hypothetical protein ACJVC5_11325 [Peredibacter sp. HCB2-198]|uniref:hypothetical protein n=1 Tax=Peredibacter sp. HCB2-198 TaxID=3383025 RepID=UPI0038B58CEE